MKAMRIAGSAAVAAVVLFGSATLALAQTATSTDMSSSTISAVTTPVAADTTLTGAASTSVASTTTVLTPTVAVPASSLTPVTGDPATISNSTSGVPGIPNTGAGGNARQNLLLLVLSALAVASGSTYLLRTKVSR